MLGGLCLQNNLWRSGLRIACVFLNAVSKSHPWHIDYNPNFVNCYQFLIHLGVHHTIRSKVLSKISSAINSSLLLTVCQCSHLTTGSSAISNQLEAGLIMIRAIKSICKLSMPLRVYGPMRSTHKHSQGFVMAVFGGRCPHLCDHLLLFRQDLQDLVSDRMVVRIPFQFIAAFIVSLRRVCPGCCR